MAAPCTETITPDPEVLQMLLMISAPTKVTKKKMTDHLLDMLEEVAA